ncbi:hypothetical protein BDY21DRAFT_362468 [Lineolata rhizophorae]|uniref:Fatty acid hydroxylase domain-containing protein n=1 Tax=Lineolata rhizophorae TaxID=578093 RepID=A0A6A6P4N6_9PEZI|nr:hypothetical protein BDY21DRAFT_362468 [Lineolata rhizophorae]
MGALVSLPLLSYLALPALSSWSTSLNILFFYVTWSTLLWTYHAFSITFLLLLSVRLLVSFIPSLLLLLLDAAVPSLAAGLKAAGPKALATRQMAPAQLARMAGLVLFNTLFGITLLSIAADPGVLSRCIIDPVRAELLYLGVLKPSLKARYGGLALAPTPPLFRPLVRVSAALPSPYNLLLEVARGAALRHVLQYAVHRRVLHDAGWSRWAAALARRHARWAHPAELSHAFALASAADHPLCHALHRWLPLLLPAALARAHVLALALNVALAAAEETAAWCGFRYVPGFVLPGVGVAQRRVEAHVESRGGCCFGTWGVLDWACGTGPSVVEDVVGGRGGAEGEGDDGGAVAAAGKKGRRAEGRRSAGEEGNGGWKGMVEGTVEDGMDKTGRKKGRGKTKAK